MAERKLDKGLYQAAFENNAFVMLIVDTALKILLVNPRFEEYLVIQGRQS